MTRLRIMTSAAVVALLTVLPNTQARARAHQSQTQVYDNDGRVAYVERKHEQRRARKRARIRHAAARARPRSHADRNISVVGLVEPLKIKVQEIVADCGSRVVSAYRAGDPRNHGKHRAADLHGNPTCIYKHLKAWPGGYSTDYHTAPYIKHVHISYNPGGSEWGLRFEHSHRRHQRTRYAHYRSHMQ